MYINDTLIFFFFSGPQGLKYLQSDPLKKVFTTETDTCFSTHKRSYRYKKKYVLQVHPINVLHIHVVI